MSNHLHAPLNLFDLSEIVQSFPAQMFRRRTIPTSMDSQSKKESSKSYEDSMFSQSQIPQWSQQEMEFSVLSQSSPTTTMKNWDSLDLFSQVPEPPVFAKTTSNSFSLHCFLQLHIQLQFQEMVSSNLSYSVQAQRPIRRYIMSI